MRIAPVLIVLSVLAGAHPAAARSFRVGQVDQLTTDVPSGLGLAV